METRKILHGNSAKIDPKKQPESLYQSNLAAQAKEKNDLNSHIAQENVLLAKKLVDENHK